MKGIGQKIDEELYPALRTQFSEGLYEGYLDRTTNPFSLKYIRKIT